MDAVSAHMLCKLNNEFYRDNAESFSNTRTRPWEGWTRVLELTGTPRSALDFACGNLRFQRYVKERFPACHIDLYGIDSCRELARVTEGVSLEFVDIVKCLLDGEDLTGRIKAPVCTLTTSFGFLHHVPTVQARMSLLKAMVSKTTAGGTIAVSFWRFADDPKRRRKAEETTAEALANFGLKLDDGDYLLGWGDMRNSYRYCHSFSEHEVRELCESLGDDVGIVDIFASDGSGLPLNWYAVLRHV